MNSNYTIVGSTVCLIGCITMYTSIQRFKKIIKTQNDKLNIIESNLSRSQSMLQTLIDENIKQTSQNSVIQSCLKSLIHEKESYDVVTPRKN